MNENARTEFETIERAEVEQLLRRQEPDNTSEDAGYALVNVLEPSYFNKEHIPNSINIPLGNEKRFERRFAKDKTIIVYCASEDCDASPKAAAKLVERGFTDVRDYEGGMKDWKSADNDVVGMAA